MHRDAERLFALDETLRREADEVLTASGIGSILSDAGFVATGSYTMRTMVWRDLDFECLGEADWETYWQVCTRLAMTGWCTRLQCVDVYRETWADHGLDCGLLIAPPDADKLVGKGDPEFWQLDAWTLRPTEVKAARERWRIWEGRLDDAKRSYILAIKEAAPQQPAYGKRLLSVHIYEAVLEHGLRDVDSFFQWWQRRGNWL